MGIFSPGRGGGNSNKTEIVKANDESVTSSTTLQNDDELFASLAAGKYRVRTQLYWTPGGSGGLKVAFAAITGATVAGINYQTSPSLRTALTTEIQRSTGQYCVEEFLLILTQAGTLQLQWAQAVSNGTPTTIKAGSNMVIEKIG